MSTRTIITSQPDVACDVCQRRLLRGEQPDIFLAAGRRRIVCELCAPRAAHEGWMRESQTQALSMPPMRPRRGRSFIDRLRQVARPAAPEGRDTLAPDGLEGADAPQPYDFLDAAEEVSAPAADVGAAFVEEGQDAGSQYAFTDFDLHRETAPADEQIERAIEVFNRSEYPRRVAGVARSLGPPVVSVRESEHVDGAISIVVAWELCWYRYEVDLGAPSAEARVLAQGTELSELAAVDQVANAAADELGELALALT